MNVTKNFTREELQCKCGCGRMEIPQWFLFKLQQLRDKYNRPMRVSSGFRCPEHNAKVSSTGPNGPHTKAAVDITVSGVDALDLVVDALELGFTGIGISQKGLHKERFVHLDALLDEVGQPRPTIWSY